MKKGRRNLSGIALLLMGLWLVFSCQSLAKETPETHGIAREIHFFSGPYRLFGYYFPSEKSFNGTGIVLCPGANYRGCRNVLYMEICRRFSEMGYVCVTFDFRGYGKSKGPKKVTQFEDLNFTKDAISAVTALIKRAPPLKEIIMIGHSMGGGVAVSAGVRDHRIGKIVSISPGRRAEELFLRKNPKLGMKWIQKRMYQDMTTKIRIPLNILRAITLPIVIASYRDFIFIKPILFVEGIYENKKDIDYLTEFVIRLKTVARKDHILLRSAHWFGTASGKRVVFPSAIQILVSTMDAWIRNDDVALNRILEKVKGAKRLPVKEKSKP